MQKSSHHYFSIVTNPNGASSSTTAQQTMSAAPPTYEEAMNLVNGCPTVKISPLSNLRTSDRPTKNPVKSNRPAQQQPRQSNIQVHNNAMPPNVSYARRQFNHNRSRPIPAPVSYPRQQAGRPQTMVQQPVVTLQQQNILTLGPSPVYIICPFCHTRKLTLIQYEPSAETHLMAAILCLVGLWCCVCLPYCVEKCHTTKHYCAQCGHFLGKFVNS